MSRRTRSPEDDEDVEVCRPLLEMDKRPRFKAIAAITLRVEPKITSERSGEVVRPGNVFEARDIVSVSDNKVHWDHLPIDETCFLDLGEGRGWAISRSLMTHHLLIEEHEENPGCRSMLRKWFQTSFYEYLVMVIVLVNAVAIGAEIDFHESLPHAGWHTINWVFAIIYVLEMGLKLTAFGFRTFFESKWNAFDFTVTLVTLVGDIIPLVTGSGTQSIISAVAPVLRLLRLLRLAKVFRELRTLMRSFLGSLSALFWIAVFALLWFYISAVICTVFVGQERWMPDHGVVPNAKALRAKFRDIPMSMYTLFEVMTLEGWTDVVQPLAWHRPILVAFFMLFLFVTAFFLLNLVTAVVVDRTLLAQQEEQESKTASEEDGQDKLLSDLIKHLTRLNCGSNMAKRKDLAKWVQEDYYVRSHISQLDWDPTLVESACAVLDKRGTGDVSILELQHLISGSVRPLDMMALVKMQLDMTQRMERQENLLKELLGKPRPGH